MRDFFEQGLPCQIFLVGGGGILKEMKATLMLRKESLHLSFETNGYIPMQPINSTTQGNLD